MPIYVRHVSAAEMGSVLRRTIMPKVSADLGVGGLPPYTLNSQRLPYQSGVHTHTGVTPALVTHTPPLSQPPTHSAAHATSLKQRR